MPKNTVPPQICSNCLFIDDGQYKPLHGSLLITGSLVGWGIVMLGVPILNVQYVSYLFGGIFIYIGLMSFRNYFKKPSKVCSKCKQRTMLPTYKPEAQNLIQEHGFMVKDNINKYCSNCHYIGKPKKIESLKYSLLIILVGIISIPISLIYNHIGLIGVLILFGTGIYGAFTNFRKPNTCPSCNQIAMIPIESDEAKSLIKQDFSESSSFSADQTKAPIT